MPNYFYTDENGQRYSLTEQRLQTLIDRGIITQITPLETDTGHQGLAGQIPGLNFPAVAPPPVTQSEQKTYYSPSRQSATYSQTNESPGTAWLFDFAFQNIRLPENGRRVCSFFYICCVITLVINGLLGFFMLNPMYSPETMSVALMFLVFYLFSSYIFLVFVRVVCELLIVLLDYMSRNREWEK